MVQKVAVFFGGASTEHDVSVITGILTLNCLDKSKFIAIPIYVTKEGAFYTDETMNSIEYFKKPLSKKAKRVGLIAGDDRLYEIGKKIKPLVKIDCAINCMHGKNGEDGMIIGILRSCSIAFASPDIFASSLAIDKDFSKIFLNGLQIPQVEYVRVKRQNYFEKSQATVNYLAKKLGFPIIVKPAKLGSSIGIYTANSVEQLLTVIPLAFNYDDKIICEKKLKNARDINCAAYFFNGKVHISKLEECLSENEILTFEDKYSGGEKTVGAKRKCPAEVDQSTAEKIIEYTQRIYLRADFYGIVRFDFLVCENGIFLNEINSVPGSMAYYLFCDKFADFTSLLSDLIEEGKRRFKRESNLITTFKSNVLKGDFKSVKK